MVSKGVSANGKRFLRRAPISSGICMDSKSKFSFIASSVQKIFVHVHSFPRSHRQFCLSLVSFVSSIIFQFTISFQHVSQTQNRPSNLTKQWQHSVMQRNDWQSSDWCKWFDGN